MLETGGEALITHFYQLLLTQHPQLKNLFNSSNLRSGEQPRALARGVLSYAKHIDHLEVLSDLVEVVVNKHVALQVQPEHYPMVGSCLLQAIVDVLGRDVATSDVIEAWGAAYQVLADILIAAETGAYSDLATQPGGWRGARQFVVVRKHDESSEITSLYLASADGKPILRHRPGQYIAIRLMIGGEEVRRTYSLSTANAADGYRISVKREPGGLVSNYLHDALVVGDAIDLFPPTGQFVLAESHRPVALISGGVGITPTIAMLQAALAAGRETYFVHTARSPDVHAFRSTVDALAAKHPNLRRFYCYSRTQQACGEHMAPGPLGEELLARWLPAGRDLDAYFLGPPGFMGSMYRALCSVGVPRSQLHYEFFGPAKLIELT